MIPDEKQSQKQTHGAPQVSTFRVLLGVHPWKRLSTRSILLLIAASAVAITCLVLELYATGNTQWGILLFIPVVSVSLAGGIVVGTVGGALVSTIPVITLLIAGHNIDSDLLFMGLATVILAAVSFVLGYVGALNVSFRRTVEEMHLLKGILPICAHCKRVRDDNGYWTRVEEYLAAHSELEFSHGYCEDCARELYSEYLDKDQIDRS